MVKYFLIKRRKIILQSNHLNYNIKRKKLVFLLFFIVLLFFNPNLEYIYYLKSLIQIFIIELKNE